jgi:hypothetical protein
MFARHPFSTAPCPGALSTHLSVIRPVNSGLNHFWNDKHYISEREIFGRCQCSGQFNYGVLLSELVRSDRDLHEALRYIKMSADQGFVSGQVNYGVFLFEGFGVELDYVEAARYLKAAADHL